MTYRMVVVLLIAGTVPLATGAVAQQNGGFEATEPSSDPIPHWKTHEEGYAGLWMRVDGAHREGLILKNMSDHGVEGTRSWARYEVEIPVPDEADHIHFGALMPGDGTAWFDSLKVEGLGRDDVPPPSDEARAYLNRALNVMEKRSVNRDAIDWSALRDSVMHKARGIETTEHTYWALRYAIGRLGDEHSSLFSRRPRLPTAQGPFTGSRSSQT